MDEKTLHFYSKERSPFVKRILSLEIDADTFEGELIFDGYYYIDDAELPKKQMMVYRHYEMLSSKRENEGIYRGRCLEALDAEIEITRREKRDDTSTFWKEELGDDGEEVDICLFPTCIQKLEFKVLDIMKDKRMKTKTDNVAAT